MQIDTYQAEKQQKFDVEREKERERLAELKVEMENQRIRDKERYMVCFERCFLVLSELELIPMKLIQAVASILLETCHPEPGNVS